MLKSLIALVFFAVAFTGFSYAAVAQDQFSSAQIQSQQQPDVAVSCSIDSDCGYGNICEYGQCTPAKCWTSNQCFPWETCNQGRCERDPWAYNCSKDSDCIAGYHCWAGYCKHW